VNCRRLSPANGSNFVAGGASMGGVYSAGGGLSFYWRRPVGSFWSLILGGGGG